MSEPDPVAENLLKRGTPRAEPPADVRARTFAAVGREWQRRKRRRLLFRAAVASAAFCVVAAGLLLNRPATFEVELARTHTLWVDDRHYLEGGHRLELRPGSRTEAASATRLIAPGHTELRLRAGTEFTWTGPDTVVLARGILYVSTGGNGQFTVRTPAGTVRDIGTIFMVAVEGETVEVAVREGATRIDTPEGSHFASAQAGESDVVRLEAGNIRSYTEPASDDRWQWIHDVHPGYREASVPLLLARIASDLGRHLVYANPGVQAAVQHLRIAGDLGGLSPEAALRVVLATNGLEQIPDSRGRLLIGLQSAGDSH